MICSRSSICLTSGCNQCFLKQNTRSWDIPRVTLIKGTDVYHDVQLLSGCCGKCGTIYYADHERIPASEGREAMKFFLNSANYLKVGQKLWVNHEFHLQYWMQCMTIMHLHLCGQIFSMIHVAMRALRFLVAIFGLHLSMNLFDKSLMYLGLIFPYEIFHQLMKLPRLLLLL